MFEEKEFVMPPERFCLACTGKLSIYHKPDDYLCYRLECHDQFEKMQREAQMRIPLGEKPLPVITTRTDMIIRAVALHFRYAPEVLCGPSCEKKYTRPRKVAYYLLKNDAKIGFTKIGRLIGGRWKSNVHQYYYDLVLDFPDFADDIAEVRALYSTLEQESEALLPAT